MAVKKMNAIDKAYTMFGRGEWVAESGKVKETRLIKELVEFAETAEKRADQAEQTAARCRRFEAYYESEQRDNKRMEEEIKKLEAKIASFNDRLNAIANFTDTQRIK